jgi:2-methylcitrate dehydratase PrpD
MTIIEELVNNIIKTSFDDFDNFIVEKAKNRIIDLVGCTLAGANAPGCSIVLDLFKKWGGREESTVLVHGCKMPVHNAALVNSIMGRSYDFESTGALIDGKSTPSHISGSTVPAVLAVAEEAGSSGKDIITALILGDDIAARLVTASKLNIDSGWDSTGTTNMFGTVAIAGKLWGLNAHQLRNAFGIVINQMAGSFQNIFDAAHAFKLPMALAAQAGIFSAALAKNGFTGATDPLTSKYGYFTLYCKSYNPDVLTKDLGKKFYAGDTFKPYPCCRSNHAGIECTLELVNKYSLIPDDIDEIIVNITPGAKDFAIGQPFQIGEVPQISAAFNLQYNVANAILRKSVKLEHFNEEFVRDPKIMDIVKKIRLVPSLPPDKPLGAIVQIKTKQGKEYKKQVDMPRGSDTLTPLTPDEKKEKFMDNAAFSKIISRDKAEKALSMLESIEKENNINSIIKLLVP